MYLLTIAWLEKRHFLLLRIARLPLGHCCFKAVSNIGSARLPQPTHFAMNNVRAINRINERELQKGVTEKGSWHHQYKDSPYVFIGGLDFSLTEGDLKTVFSQYGKVIDINLARDKESGASRGFAFLGYHDARSAVLAVDNFNGISLAGRVIRVDHVLKYKSPEELEEQRKRKQGLRTKYAQAITDELFKSAAGEYLLFPTDYSQGPVDESDAQKDFIGEEEEEAKTIIERARESKEERRRRIKDEIERKSSNRNESKEEKRARKEAKRQKKEEKRRAKEAKRDSKGNYSKHTDNKT